MNWKEHAPFKEARGAATRQSFCSAQSWLVSARVCRVQPELVSICPNLHEKKTGRKEDACRRLRAATFAPRAKGGRARKRKELVICPQETCNTSNGMMGEKEIFESSKITFNKQLSQDPHSYNYLNEWTDRSHEMK